MSSCQKTCLSVKKTIYSLLPNEKVGFCFVAANKKHIFVRKVKTWIRNCSER